MAAHAGLDLAAIRGSGPQGRIVKADIERSLAAPAARPTLLREPSAIPAPIAALSSDAPFEEKPHSSMRRVIARRMAEAKQTVPHYYMSVDCTIDELLRVRAVLNADREQALKLRVDTQHRSVVDELRSGKLRLTIPNDAKGTVPHLGAAYQSAAALHLELLNAKTWLSGKRAMLQIAVNDNANKPVERATVMARVEGAAELAAFSAETNLLGRTKVEFEMPALVGPEVALVIEASKGKAHAHLRFQLRAKPRVPSGS
jgi:hypothetical protein